MNKPIPQWLLYRRGGAQESFMGSDTWQEWLDVAHERMVDAKSMLPTRSGSVGSVYLAGYAAKAASRH